MYNPNSSEKSREHQTIESSLRGFATALALIAAFLLAPKIHEYISPTIYAYLLETYSSQLFAQLGQYVFVALATVGVFFLCRALLVLGLFILAQRLIFLSM